MLKVVPAAPPLLFVRGDPDYLQLPQLAMVGSRTPTAAGRRTALEFARHLSQAGITITSGLARGIDAACHQGALDSLAGTVALVAHGLDIVYPAEHGKLAEAISENGAIVSEHPIGTRPLKAHFPRRNRLISGLSLGTLVVEAALKSGSLITTRHALEQGREVFAIPGSIHNPLARGCHQLIRQGAKLVETASDILEELSALLPGDLSVQALADAETPAENQSSRIFDPDHQQLLKCLAYEPMPIDELVNRSGFSAPEVASMLLILELEGCVVSESGLYTRLA
jgi:DNA processing protein